MYSEWYKFWLIDEKMNRGEPLTQDELDCYKGMYHVFETFTNLDGGDYGGDID